MALNDLEHFRMVAKIVLEQEGDDIEEGTHKHIVPQIESIDINPKNPEYALVANQQSFYFVDATSSDLEDRIVAQYSVPPDLFIKEAIFCPMLQYRIGTRIGWKPDIIVAIRYDGQRYVHIANPLTGAMIKVMLPFVPVQLIVPRALAKDTAGVIPQPLLALGQQEFSIIAVQDYFSFTGENDLSAHTNTYRIPVFANANDPISASFGEDPSVLFILNGNYFYRYEISLIPAENEHAIDNQEFEQHFARMREQDPMEADLCAQLMKQERAFARPGKCQLKCIYKLNMDRVLMFEFSHSFEVCAFLTSKNIHVYNFTENKLTNSLLVCEDFGIMEDELEFVPFIEQIVQDQQVLEDEDIDIFAEAESTDCSVISEDIEVSNGEELKVLADRIDEHTEIKGWFDQYLVKSEIINREAKAQLLINVLKQHPHLYVKFKEMYKANITQKQNLQKVVENFGQQMLFTEDDLGIIVRPNIFSGFSVFELGERLSSNVRIWEPVNITSVQDYQSKHCSAFVSGENIFLLGIGNALYFSAIE